MDIGLKILVAVHVTSAALWVGAVFMGSVIDPPALRRSADDPWFLVNFIVAQGSRVFPWVYLSMTVIFVTGFALVWLHPPQNTRAVILLALKFTALAIMAGNTIYGTLVTWPKVQFASPEEVRDLWKPYLSRAYITLGAGIVAFVLGTVLY
jgi:uncharacterized membrane protein